MFGLFPGVREELYSLSRLPEALTDSIPDARRSVLAQRLAAIEAWLGPERYPRYIVLWQELYEQESLN